MPLLTVLMFTLLNDAETTSKLVARCAGHEIRYEEIAVTDRALTLPRRPEASHLSNAELQHGMEQRNLDDRITALALDFAVRHFGLEIRREELETATPPNIRDEATFRRDFEPMLAVPRAARRVLHGEDKTTVFREMLAQYSGMTEAFFQQSLLLFNSDESIDKFLSVDQAARSRQKAIDKVRLGIIRRKLQLLAQSRADKQHESLADAKSSLWQELLGAADTVVLDPSFRLPASNDAL